MIPSHSRSSRRPAGPVLGAAFVLALAACSAPDPFPGGAAQAPPGRLPDDLLNRPDLQAVVEATLARDGESLVGYLTHPDAAVRARAAYGLGSVQDPRAVPALTELLMDPQARVREDAAFALGQVDGGAGPQLLQALRREEDPRVRKTLVEALGKRGGAAEMEALLGMTAPDMLAEITLALSQGVIREVAPEYAVDTLVARMRHPDPGVRRGATYFMARLQVPNVWFARLGEVTSALASYDRDDEAAMYVLAGLGRGRSLFTDPVAVSWLRTSPDWRIRANAAVAVGSLYEFRPDVGDALLEALDDPSPHVRQRAGEALAPAPPSRPVLEGIVRRVQARPDDAALVTPLLPLLVRVGAVELVHEHMEALTPDDPQAWNTALDAFRELPASVVLSELSWMVTAENAPDQVAARASAQLVDRWELVRGVPEAQEAYFRMATATVPRGEPHRVLPLAAVLADSALLDRGTLEPLQAFLDRVPEGETRESLIRILALSPDPRARALVDPERVAALQAEALAEAEAAEDAPSGDAAAGEAADVDAAPQEPLLAVDWEALRALGPRPRLVLDTERGRVVVVLRTEEAPLTVQAVASLASQGRYDDVPFHRVVPNFVIQGGDVSDGDGTGGPEFVLRSEFTRTPFLRGVMGMASSGKDTEGSQYFIDHSPQWHLDGGYTAFGWVQQGMDVVDLIQRGDRVIRARVLPSR